MKKGLGRDHDSGADDPTDIFTLGRDHVKRRGCAKIDHHQTGTIKMISGNRIDNTVGTHFLGI